MTLGAVGTEFADTLLAADVHFISGTPLKEPLEVTAKVRYQARPEPAVLYPEGDFVRVAFAAPQRAVTPGAVRCVLRRGYRARRRNCFEIKDEGVMQM